MFHYFFNIFTRGGGWKGFAPHHSLARSAIKISLGACKNRLIQGWFCQILIDIVLKIKSHNIVPLKLVAKNNPAFRVDFTRLWMGIPTRLKWSPPPKFIYIILYFCSFCFHHVYIQKKTLYRWFSSTAKRRYLIKCLSVQKSGSLINNNHKLASLFKPNALYSYYYIYMFVYIRKTDHCLQ